MNIEQKNTLFIISLVLIVLLGVAGAAFLLVHEHVSKSIQDDLDRAHDVFVQTRKTRFENLLAVARSARDEPGLIAAVQSGDMAAVRGAVADFYPRTRADVIAVYLDNGPGRSVGVGNKSYYTSSHILGSAPLSELVKSLAEGEPEGFGNTLVYDSLLQLAAVTIDQPRGARIGTLVIGNRFAESDLGTFRQLVRTDAAIFSGDAVLVSSIGNLQASLDVLNALPASTKAATIKVDGERYSVHILPVLSRPGAGETAAKVLLAARHSSYWAPYQQLAINAGYFSLLILLVAALIGISISRCSLTRPIQLLAKATHAIANGDMTQKVLLKRNDELGQLTRSFNAMLAALNASQSELRSSRKRFRDFAASSSDWLWETDHGGHFTFVSTSVSDTLYMSADSWLGRTPVEVFPGSNLGELTALLRSGDKSGEGFKDVEIWVHARDGDQHCLRLNGVPLYSGDTFIGYRGTARDITKIKQDEKRMVLLANQDHLTGLSNRSRFIQDLNHEIRRVERHSQPGVLLLIDIDHLKLINDTAGHAAGDQIIVQLAGLLRSASRDQDLVARISGDEFAIAYSAMDEQQGAEKAAELLQSIHAMKPRYGGRALNISASIGFVVFPVQGKVPVELLAKADAAMSSAKASGRNRVHQYDETDMMRERMDNQLVWKDRLLEALERDALQLAFQPIVSVSSGQIHHYEVLARMRGKNGVLISPAKFIPTAEQFGLIQQVDQQILTKAIRCLAGLPAELSHVGFSINLSGMSVGSSDLYKVLEREVREAAIEPGRVTFEITETAACEQLNNAVEFIHKVRRLGCRISLDDFGVGFSSFSYLKHLRADILKIDGSFIRDIHNNAADQLFVKALVDVARGMGMRTIAECVENEQVHDRVRRLGVDYVQGYYLGKPQSSLVSGGISGARLINASVA